MAKLTILNCCFRFGLLAVGSVFMNSAFAHHSYAQFDPCIAFTIAGDVRSAEYANPHIVLNIETVDGAIYRIEWMSLQALARNGLEPNVVAVGDYVEITGARHRDPEFNVMTMLREFIRPGDGWAWQPQGNQQARRERPAACFE
jgi:hypothetical protein